MLGQLPIVLLTVALCAPPPGSAVRPPALDVPVSLSFTLVPLHRALERVFEGSGLVLDVASDVPAPLLSAEFRGKSRAAVALSLIRLGGAGGLTLECSQTEVRVRKVRVERVTSCGGTVTTALSGGFTSTTGEPTGPNGQRLPSQSGVRVGTTLRSTAGVPTQAGGATSGRIGSSQSGPPSLPLGSRVTGRVGSSGGIFVTVTEIPDPAGERDNRRNR